MVNWCEFNPLKKWGELAFSNSMMRIHPPILWWGVNSRFLTKKTVHPFYGGSEFALYKKYINYIIKL